MAVDFFQWRGKISHQGWDGHDLVAPSQLGILQKIDQLNAVSVRQMLRANPLEIREGANRLRRLSRDIKPQYPSIVPRLGMLNYFRAGHFFPLFGLLAGCWTRHRPDGSTPWRFDRLRLPAPAVFVRVSPAPSLLSLHQTPHA